MQCTFSQEYTQWCRNEFESGGTDKIFVAPLHFLAIKLQLVVLVSAFVMVSTVCSVSCLLFFYSRCPRALPFVKVGARAPVPHGVGATEYTESCPDGEYATGT